MKEFLQGRWLGHPLHAALVHVPTAVWPAAAVFDVLTRLGVGGAPLAQASRYAILAGLVVAALAAAAGFADWWDIKPDRPAKRIGLYHLGLNLVATVLFAVSLWLRWGLPAGAAVVPPAPTALSVMGAVIVLFSGYLGGLMVYDHGISVARFSKKKWRKAAEAGGARVPSEQKG